jgi:hypothetical protein
MNNIIDFDYFSFMDIFQRPEHPNILPRREWSRQGALSATENVFFVFRDGKKVTLTNA